ncbi:MAG: hypothetical protein H0U27_01145 [Nitrosopumilus sp.]|nr:hypothetical protein [Nitrosopumilus sp.]
MLQIPSGSFCIPIILVSATIRPAPAIDTQLSSEFGGYLIQLITIPAPSRFFSEIRSAIINTTAHPKKNNVCIIPMAFLASVTIPRIAAK